MNILQNRRLQLCGVLALMVVCLATLGSGLASGASHSSISAHARAGALTLSMANQHPKFRTNRIGETYGSSFNTAPTSQPQLISAIGTNPAGQQVQGYVLSANLTAATGGTPATPSQAQAEISSAPASIPLYAQDGVTVLGTFAISPTQETVQP